MLRGFWGRGWFFEDILCIGLFFGYCGRYKGNIKYGICFRVIDSFVL